MPEKFLVAYATRYGSTREVAEKIAATLRERGANVFGGKFDPARLTFPYNLIPALKRMPVSDIRDWDAVHAWAMALVEKLAR